MDKEDVVYRFNGILFIHKKEWNFAICNNMDGSWGHYAKWKKPDREIQILKAKTKTKNQKNQSL